MTIRVKFACGCFEDVESFIGGGELEVKGKCATCCLAELDNVAKSNSSEGKEK